MPDRACVFCGEVPQPPIYPIPIKPNSAIRSWEGWPDDVRPVLWEWNHGWPSRSRLSFYGTRVFKCPDCDAFCAPSNVAAHFDGAFYCDDCMILKARAELAASA